VKQVLGLRGVCDQVFTMQSGSSARASSSQRKAFWTRSTSSPNRGGVQAVLAWRHSPKCIFGCTRGATVGGGSPAVAPSGDRERQILWRLGEALSVERRRGSAEAHRTTRSKTRTDRPQVKLSRRKTA
jgi:hypothetical protein